MIELPRPAQLPDGPADDVTEDVWRTAKGAEHVPPNWNERDPGADASIEAAHATRARRMKVLRYAVFAFIIFDFLVFVVKPQLEIWMR